MNPLKVICVLSLILAAVSASPNENAVSNSLNPTQWLTKEQLESTPSVEDITMQQLENMPLQEGAQLIEKLYHLSQINHNLPPTFVPSPSNIPVKILNAAGQNKATNLNEMDQAIQQCDHFGKHQVTIYITGLPPTSSAVLKANKKLVQAYMQRYNGRMAIKDQNDDYDQGTSERTSSEETLGDVEQTGTAKGNNLVIINLGATITNAKRFMLLDVEQTGNMIAKMLVQLTNRIPRDIIHIVGQGIGAQVAGAAGRQYNRLTGHKLRRITALDPSKVFARYPHTLTGLARGDADFVDAIHTSAYGLGTPQRVGDVDFYPNGPSVGVPGAKNVIEAAMRAVRYYAESVRPGNERNFPAIAANSVQQYKNNNGNGAIAYMGIATEYDTEGDYMLEVNEKSPFGQRTPIQMPNNNHGVHEMNMNIGS